MSGYETYRRDLLALFQPAIEIAYSRDAIESAQRLADAARRLREGRLMTVVCGEFKRGKSCLLGALTEEPGLFPVDVDIATSMVTTISYGATERIEVILAADGAERAMTIDRAAIPRYVTEQQNPGNTQRVQLLTILTPSARLATGLTFVDTPGVGALNSEHTAVTYGFLPAADAVIFVSDATTPLTESELDFVRKISEYCPLILFVVTKIDLRDDYPQVVSNTRAKLAEVTGKPADSLLVIPVSSTAKLAYLQDRDEDDLELSNFPALERALRDVLEERRGQILLTRAASDLTRASEALAYPIRTQLTAARDTAGTELAALTSELEEKERRIAELKEGSAQWRSDLRKYIGEMSTEIRSELNRGLGQIWQLIPSTYLEDDRMLDQPTLIISALEADVGLLLGSLAQRATQRAASVQDRLERETGLALARQTVGEVALPHTELEIAGHTPRSETATDRRMRTLRDVRLVGGLGMSTGGIIGGLIGGPIGAPIGAAIGALVAGGFGYRNASKSMRLHDLVARRNSIRSELVPVQGIHRAEAERAIDTAISELLAAIERDLDAKIRLEYESVATARRTLQEAKTRAADDSLRRVQDLAREVDQLDRGLARCREILGAVAAEARQLAPALPGDPEPQPAKAMATLPSAGQELLAEPVFDDPGTRVAGEAG
jgi:uncharacterized protein YcfJ/GTP-binding protein EngB required for normal cell division